MTNMQKRLKPQFCPPAISSYVFRSSIVSSKSFLSAAQHEKSPRRDFAWLERKRTFRDTKSTYSTIFHWHPLTKKPILCEVINQPLHRCLGYATSRRFQGCFWGSISTSLTSWNNMKQGLVNVQIKHHPTIGDIISHTYLKVMSKIPRKDQKGTFTYPCETFINHDKSW